MIVVTSVAELFAVFGSEAVDTTAASLVIVAGWPASTLISTVAVAPLAIVPSAHVTVLPRRTQLPCVGVADT